jgi:hypothetical protein
MIFFHGVQEGRRVFGLAFVGERAGFYTYWFAVFFSQVNATQYLGNDGKKESIYLRVQEAFTNLGI